MSLPWLDPRNNSQPFPPLTQALTEPNGLLAVGGSLNPHRMLRAYRLGIFPWYSAGQPILWWSPDPRLVLFPERIKIARSLGKVLRNKHFTVTADRVFSTVIDACAQPRAMQTGTWITSEMRDAYCELHRLGHAHSIEVWQDGNLVGGLYGVALGRIFYGESMFTRISNASKVALVALTLQLRRWGFVLIDCQVRTEHLVSLGAVEISRQIFSQFLDRYCPYLGREGAWELDQDWLIELFPTKQL